MISTPSAAMRMARAAWGRALQSPTSQQMVAAMATAGVTAIRLTATLGAGGAVTLTFPAPYVTAPTVVPVSRFIGNRGYFAVVGSISTLGVELTGKRNKGTLLLSDGPNEAAASGDVVEVMVIGRPA
ncbi:hypothetical protein [Pseudomonas sp. NMI1173_11]|uniref:hypothetical protein n=1 Tax=Pseudomonas sp. NMI1173_11 TaxID=2903145 RepID=UPI001E4AB91B|nr:hypothetical protein [Pseudomonas sp. NMI1173_11]MCE1001820.1 hypothetical protein [Pseudomonas sp. NMI1173_11]